MSPRPVAFTDEQILAAASRTITRIGPVRLTLADVAGEINAAPATLVKRFGSKHGLLVALARHSVTAVERAFQDAMASGSAPLAALEATLTDLGATVGGPAEMVHHLAFLQMDLTEPDLHQQAREFAATMRAGVRQLLGRAYAGGELAACDLDRLAGAIQVTYNGTLITWAIYADGDLSDWFRRELEFLLAPYRVVGRG